MGKIQVDIYKKARQWDYATLSDPDVVKGLIMFRDVLDIYYNIRFNALNPDDVKEMNESIICLYLDLDNLVAKCRFNEFQLRIIQLLSQGYKFNEISNLLNSESRKIKTSFNGMCTQIANENEKQWNIWININYIDKGWKLCGKCNELLPKTELFFNSDFRNRDGLYSWCKKCFAEYRKSYIRNLPKRVS